jgi:neutral trehalase
MFPANTTKARPANRGAPKRTRHTFKEQAEFIKDIRAAKDAGHCTAEQAVRKVTEKKGVSADTFHRYYKKRDLIVQSAANKKLATKETSFDRLWWGPLQKLEEHLARDVRSRRKSGLRVPTRWVFCSSKADPDDAYRGPTFIDKSNQTL